jgi:hypothetical protein
VTTDGSTHGGVEPRNKWGDSSFSKIITSMITELSSDLDVPSPVGYHRLVALMRIVLDETGTCTKMEVQGYTMYSARHTLLLITRLRGESVVDSQEIGRWSMSTTQDPTLRPL